jgi:hypothetical protein
MNTLIFNAHAIFFIKKLILEIYAYFLLIIYIYQNIHNPIFELINL